MLPHRTRDERAANRTRGVVTEGIEGQGPEEEGAPAQDQEHDAPAAHMAHMVGHPTDIAVAEAAPRVAATLAEAARHTDDVDLVNPPRPLPQPAPTPGALPPPPAVENATEEGETGRWQRLTEERRAEERMRREAVGPAGDAVLNRGLPLIPPPPRAPDMRRQDEIGQGSPDPADRAVIEGLPPPPRPVQLQYEEVPARQTTVGGAELRALDVEALLRVAHNPEHEPVLRAEAARGVERLLQAAAQDERGLRGTPPPRLTPPGPAAQITPGTDGFFTAREGATPLTQPPVGDSTVEGLLAQLQQALQGRPLLQFLNPGRMTVAEMSPVTPGTIPGLSPTFPAERAPQPEALLGGLRVRPGHAVEMQRAAFFADLRHLPAAAPARPVPRVPPAGEAATAAAALVLAQMQRMAPEQEELQRLLTAQGIARAEERQALRNQAERGVLPLQFPERLPAPNPDPSEPGSSSSDDDRRRLRHRALEPPTRDTSSAKHPPKSVPAAPLFLAAIGALPNRTYCAALQRWFSSNSCTLEKHQRYQLSLLVASLSGAPAAIFFEMVRAELQYLCPSAAEMIEAMDASDGVNNMHHFWATAAEGSERGSASTTAGQASGKPVQKLMAAMARQARKRAKQSGVSVGADGDADQEQVWQEYHEGRVYSELFMAWQAVVQRLLTKPGADEIGIWTGEKTMMMGLPNPMSPDVPANEGPIAFVRRLTDTYQILTDGSGEAFRERASQLSPTDAFLNGLPKNFPRKQALIWHLAGIDTTAVDEFTRIGEIADMAQTFWTNATLAANKTLAQNQASAAFAPRPRPAVAEQSVAPRRGGWASRRIAAAGHGEPGEREEWFPVAAAAEIQPMGMRPTAGQMRTTMQEHSASQGTQQGGRGGRGGMAGSRGEGRGGRGSQQDVRADQGRASWQDPRQQQGAPRQGQGQPGQRGGPGQGQSRGQAGPPVRSSSPSGCRFCKSSTHTTFECSHWAAHSKAAEQEELALTAPRQQQAARTAAAGQRIYQAYAGTTCGYEGQFQWSLESEPEEEDFLGVQCSAASAAAQPLPSTASLTPLLSPADVAAGAEEDSDGDITEQLAFTAQAMLASVTALQAALQVQAVRRSERRKEPTWRAKKEFPETFTPAKTGSNAPTSPRRPSPRPGLTAPPAGFNVACVPEVPSTGQYQVMLSNNNTLTYALNSPTAVEKCVGIMLQGSDTVHYRGIRAMFDSGASINLITKKMCLKLGIPILPTTMQLATSTSEGNSLVGVTPMIAIVYGAGLSNPLVVWHQFYVTDGMDSLYQVLIGNLDTIHYGAVFDFGQRMLTMRPQFEQRGASSSVISIDICQKGAQPAHLMAHARMALTSTMHLTDLSLPFRAQQMAHVESDVENGDEKKAEGGSSTPLDDDDDSAKLGAAGLSALGEGMQADGSAAVGTITDDEVMDDAGLTPESAAPSPMPSQSAAPLSMPPQSATPQSTVPPSMPPPPVGPPSVPPQAAASPQPPSLLRFLKQLMPPQVRTGEDQGIWGKMRGAQPGLSQQPYKQLQWFDFQHLGPAAVQKGYRGQENPATGMPQMPHGPALPRIWPRPQNKRQHTDLILRERVFLEQAPLFIIQSGWVESDSTTPFFNGDDSTVRLVQSYTIHAHDSQGCENEDLWLNLAFKELISLWMEMEGMYMGHLSGQQASLFHALLGMSVDERMSPLTVAYLSLTEKLMQHGASRRAPDQHRDLLVQLAEAMHRADARWALGTMVLMDADFRALGIDASTGPDQLPSWVQGQWQWGNAFPTRWNPEPLGDLYSELQKWDGYVRSSNTWPGGWRPTGSKQEQLQKCIDKALTEPAFMRHADRHVAGSNPDLYMEVMRKDHPSRGVPGFFCQERWMGDRPVPCLHHKELIVIVRAFVQATAVQLKPGARTDPLSMCSWHAGRLVLGDGRAFYPPDRHLLLLAAHLSLFISNAPFDNGVIWDMASPNRGAPCTPHTF